jgi:hypothetical protein
VGSKPAFFILKVLVQIPLHNLAILLEGLRGVSRFLQADDRGVVQKRTLLFLYNRLQFTNLSS